MVWLSLSSLKSAAISAVFFMERMEAVSGSRACWRRCEAPRYTTRPLGSTADTSRILLAEPPGCPPRPEMLLNAIIELHDQIQNSKLGVNRVAAARAAEEAALRATPTSLMAPTHDHLAHLAAPAGKNLLA